MIITVKYNNPSVSESENSKHKIKKKELFNIICNFFYKTLANLWNNTLLKITINMIQYDK